MSACSSSRPSFKTPYVFSQLDNRRWYCTLCSTTDRAYHNSFSTNQAAMKHEASKEHRRRLEVGPVNGWWEHPPAAAADWCAPEEKTGWDAWAEKGGWDDEWKDESGWFDSETERIRQWLANVEALKEQEREKEWITGCQEGNSNGSGSGKGGKRKKGRGKKQEEDLSQKYLSEPSRGVPEALGWDVPVKPAALRALMEQVAEEQGYTTKRKQRANNFLQLPTEQKVHQIRSLVMNLRPLLLASH